MIGNLAIGGFGVHAQQGPTGRWFLVGTVPVRAGYERKDGAPLTESDIVALVHVGPGLVPHCRARTFDTKQAALNAAEAWR